MYVMIYLLLLYILFIIGYIIYSAIAIYHLKRFGYVGDLTKPVMIIYSVVSASIIILSFIIIATRSWPIDFKL